nr:unnamed protein product [Digitaria exilis]
MSCAAPPWWKLPHGFGSGGARRRATCSATSGRGPPTGEAAAGRRIQHPRALAAPRGGLGGGQAGAGGATFNCNGSTRGGDSSSRSCGARPRRCWAGTGAAWRMSPSSTTAPPWPTGRDAATRRHTAPAAGGVREVLRAHNRASCGAGMAPSYQTNILLASCDSPASPTMV